MASLNQNRRTIVHTLRNETAMKIFPKLAQYQNIAMKDRRTHLEFKSALMFAGEDKVSKFAPILFEDREYDMEKLFKCASLALVRVQSLVY
jgi:hypothetical protein